MERLAVVLTLLFVPLSLWTHGRARADEPTEGRVGRFKVQDLAFLAGRWKGTFGGGPAEETWSPPLGNAMVGTFQAVKDGKTTLYEILVFEELEEGVALRLRHFNARLEAWESEKDGPMTFPLVSLTEAEAVFEDPARPWPQRMTYRVEEGTTLRIELGGTREGRPHAFAFVFQRAADGE